MAIKGIKIKLPRIPRPRGSASRKGLRPRSGSVGRVRRPRKIGIPKIKLGKTRY